MNKRVSQITIRSFVGFWATALLVASFGGASILAPSVTRVRPLEIDESATRTVEELDRLGILARLPQSALEDLLTFQRRTGRSLAQIVKDPSWQAKLGLTSNRFKATWYASNPYDLLPSDLKAAIATTPVPFRNRRDLEKWCKTQKASPAWLKGLSNALVETTPENLWRASRGGRPFAKNGQLLEPIVVERAAGSYEVHDGHIATDPSIVPTNSEALMIVRVNGKDRLIRVKAADIGQAIRGRHVDLPIQIAPGSTSAVPYIRFPKEYIRNPTVEILTLANPSQKG